MIKEENIIRYYVLCNKLKDVIRTGWKDFKVTRERVESVAEHIYGVQMLAISMYSEFNYDIDIYKVIFMLAVHELEEIVIGDLTPFQITEEDKMKIGHDAISKVLNNLNMKESIEKLILEFDDRKTKEAKFAYQCDKLEADLQCKLYDEENCVKEENWSNKWIINSKKRHNFDNNFESVLDYALNNEINDIQKR